MRNEPKLRTIKNKKIIKETNEDHEDSLLSYSRFIPNNMVVKNAWIDPVNPIKKTAEIHTNSRKKYEIHQRGHGTQMKLILPDVFTKRMVKKPTLDIFHRRNERYIKFTSHIIPQSKQLDSDEISTLIPLYEQEITGFQSSISTESESSESLRSLKDNVNK